MKRVALVGCGHIHTPNFVDRLAARKDEIQVVWVWDHNEARCRATAEKLGASVAASPETVWGDASVGSVIICSETNRHLELTLAAVAAKKDVYVEKPLGMGAADAWRMAKAVREAGVIFQTGYMQRGGAINRFIKQQLEAGAFGKVTRVRHQNCHSGSLGGWFDTEWRWMADPSVAGVGGFGDLGFHSLDLLLWMFGAPEKVTATVQVVTGRYGDACDETGEALIQFPDGTIASMAAGWVDVQQPVTLMVSGTEGHACVFNGQLYFKSSHVEGADGKTPWTALPEMLPHPFELYLDALLGKDVPLIDVGEAALDSAVMEAMYAASREQVWKAPVLG